MTPEVANLLIGGALFALGVGVHYVASRLGGQAPAQALAASVSTQPTPATASTDLASIVHKLIDQQSPPAPAAVDPSTQILSMFLPVLQNAMASAKAASPAQPQTNVTVTPAATAPAQPSSTPTSQIGNGLLLSQIEQMIEQKFAKLSQPASTPAPSMAIKAAA